MSKQAQPALNSRRPDVMNSLSATEKLRKLDNWTTEPTVTALEAIQLTQIADAPNDINLELKPALALKKELEGHDSNPDLPWHNASEDKLAVFMFKPSEVLHLKLKFLGETTYGMTMQKIIVEAVEERVAALLKARGIT